MASRGKRPSAVHELPAHTQRLSAASGAVGAVLLAISFGIVGTDIPTYDDSPQEFASFYAHNASTIELSLLLGLFGAAALAWFFGFLRWYYGSFERGSRGFQSLTPVAFGSAIAGLAVSLLFNASHETAVISQGTASPGAVRAFDLFGSYALTSAAVLFSGFLLASVFLIQASGVLPTWLGLVAAIGTVLGFLQAFVLVAPSTDNGLLGAIGYAWFFVFLIWLLGASITLALRSET
jgi:hypothetical protein